MGEGMRMLARLGGGLIVMDRHGVVEYGADGRIKPVKTGSIAFCGEMMRALLAGDKTVTRRMRPKGQVGDVLWVKEGLERLEKPDLSGSWVSYSATGGVVLRQDDADVVGLGPVRWPWKRARLPAMYCPRWASRVTLRLLDVRQEHLSQITEDDARREGFESRNQFLELFRRLHPELPAGADPLVYRHAFEVIR